MKTKSALCSLRAHKEAAVDVLPDLVQKRVGLLEQLNEEFDRLALLEGLVLCHSIGVEELVHLLSPATPRQAIWHEDEGPLPAGAAACRKYTQACMTGKLPGSGTHISRMIDGILSE